MAGTFSFELEGRRGLIRTALAGFFSVEDVRRYERERNRALAALGCAANAHLTLCDASRCQLSAPEVVAELQRVIGDERYRSRRCAMVVPGALARMQARRAIARDDAAMFDTVAEAEAWLFDPAAQEHDKSPPPCANPLASKAGL